MRFPIYFHVSKKLYAAQLTSAVEAQPSPTTRLGYDHQIEIGKVRKKNK